jgi:hypothetical protein
MTWNGGLRDRDEGCLGRRGCEDGCAAVVSLSEHVMSLTNELRRGEISATSASSTYTRSKCYGHFVLLNVKA